MVSYVNDTIDRKNKSSVIVSLEKMLELLCQWLSDNLIEGNKKNVKFCCQLGIKIDSISRSYLKHM